MEFGALQGSFWASPVVKEHTQASDYPRPLDIRGIRISDIGYY